MIRFRFLSDISGGSTGWFVDDITLNNLPVVFMKSNLFNGSNVLQATATNSVEIINVCTAPAITTQPQPNTLCTGSNASFSVAATGNGLVYQWELSTDGGGSWNPIPGAAAATYTITGPTSALNGRLYRCVINNACGTVTSNAASLYVSPPLTHSGVTANPTTVCVPAPSTISGTAGGGSVGGTFGNYTHTLTGPGTIVANPPTGPNNETGSFTVTNAPAGVNNYIFTSRDGLNCPVTTTVTLTTSAPPVITTQPVARVICQGASTTFSLVASGLNLTYQWQLSTNVGGTWNNIPGATANSTAVTGAALSQSGHQYRCIVTSACGSLTSSAVTLTVTPNPIHQNVSATPNPVCEPGPVVLAGTAVGGTLLGGSDIVIANSGSINLAIQDLATVTNNLTVPAFTFSTAANLKIRLNITHTWIGDITISVTNPCGTAFVFNRPGFPASALGNDADLNGVYLFDLAAAAIIPEAGGGVIPAGSFKPSDAAGNAHNWTGLTFPCSAAGTWTISISDAEAGDAGILADWSIIGPGAAGQYTHSMTGPFTITANPPTGGPSNPTANFTASNLAAGTQTYNLTTADSRGCTATSPITVTVNPRPSSIIAPAAVNVCIGSSTQLMVLDTATIRTSTVPVIIPDSGPGIPYPGTLSVTGLPAAARVRSVTLSGFSHTFPGDLDILLQSPNGTNVILMSDRGGGSSISNVTYTFIDGAPLLGTGFNPSGTYRPTNTAGPDNFPAPGPGSITQINPTLALFNTAALTPNGVWNLFVFDQFLGDQGSITSWSITFDIPGAQTITYTWSPATGLSSATGNPVTATPTVNTTYSVSAVNSFGCSSSGLGNAVVTVLALPAITAQPSPATQIICPGYNVTYSVTAAGAGLTYQWRKNNVNLVNAGSVSGATSAILTLTAVTAADAGSYDVIVSGSCPPSLTSNAAVLQIGNLPTITAQPLATTTVCERFTTTIAVLAAALPPIQIYQWQISINNGATYTNMTNSTVAGSSPFYTNVFSAALTIANAPLSITGYRYRCVITTNCGFTITSNASTLTVNPTPAATANLVTGKICISDTLVLLSGSPAGGVWSGAGVYNGNQFLPYLTSVGTFPIKYKVTNTFGCFDSAIINIKVEDCPERIRLLSNDGVLLYPNPNSGQFNIRVNSVLYNYLGMKVFSSHGALVKQQKWSNLPYGRVLPIDIRHLAAGIYMVYVFYEDGVRTSEKTFRVIVPGH
jgi:subtilisin-like proprotein convertase family protein